MNPPTPERSLQESGAAPVVAGPIRWNRLITIAAVLLVAGLAAGWLPRWTARRALAAETRELAVTTVAVVVAADSIGIYSVSTLSPYRRKGYAESLMRQVIGQYTRQTGIERAVLQATRAGFDMYRKMGFRPVSHFTVYMT